MSQTYSARLPVLQRAAQRFDKIGPVHMQVLAAPPRMRRFAQGNHQYTAAAPAEAQLLRPGTERIPLDPRADTQRFEHPHAIRADLQAGADFIQNVGLFEDGDLMPQLLERQSGRQPADTST